MSQCDARDSLIVVIYDDLKNGAGQQIIEPQGSVWSLVRVAPGAGVDAFGAAVAFACINGNEVTTRGVLVSEVRHQYNSPMEFSFSLPRLLRRARHRLLLPVVDQSRYSQAEL